MSGPERFQNVVLGGGEAGKYIEGMYLARPSTDATNLVSAR